MVFSDSEQQQRRALPGAGQSHRFRAQGSLAIVRRHAAAVSIARALSFDPELLLMDERSAHWTKSSAII